GGGLAKWISRGDEFETYIRDDLRDIFSVVVDFKIQICKVLFQNPDLQKIVCTGSVWMGVAWIGGVWIAGAWMSYVWMVE
ncbi:unnamed protein product, partial [Brassica oleracea]